MRTSIHIPAAIVLVTALAPGQAQAQGSAVAAEDNALPTMRAHRVDEPIRIDGNLDEAIWARVPSASGFVQMEPVEGDPAFNDSEVWLLYDDDAVYVGAILHDVAPHTIARNMARRDAIYLGQFDYFEVMLDPNLDQRTGYRFRVTAANVQTDRYLYDDSREDGAWDGVWESGVQVDERGWIVEMRIPLSQMRYETSDGPQTWGINWGRRRAADNELTRFALESRLRTGRLSQMGLVEGIVLTRSPRRLEVRPYVVASSHTAPATAGDPFFDGSELSTRTGFELRYGLGSAFTVDATISPDFGQVEADPAVVNLTAFETFFQERRPFFVEDARVFDFTLSGRTNQLFYSRRIGRTPQGSVPPGADFADVPDATTILGATKITGRTSSGLSVGVLGALTEREEGSAFFSDLGQTSDYVAQPRGGFGVVRLEQDFRGGASNVGGIFTAQRRSLPGDGSFDFLTSTSYSTGIDFEHNWSQRNWALWGFFAGSQVRGSTEAITRIQRASNHYRQRPDLAWAEFDTTAIRMTGAEWRLQLEKRRGNWRGAVWAAELTPGFEVNDLGFSTAQERLDGGASVRYQDVTPGDVLRAYTLSGTSIHNFSHEVLRDVWSLDSWKSARTAGSFSTTANLTFLNYWNLTSTFSYTPERVSRTMTRGGPRMVNPAEQGFRVSLRTDNRSKLWVRSTVDLTDGHDGSGSRTRATLGLSLQPSSRLRVSLDPTFTWETEGAQYVATTGSVPFEPTYGDRYLFADLQRRTLSVVTRANWTFTPDLTFELFAQSLLSSGDYLRYKELAAPETFTFDAFEEGTFSETNDVVTCAGGRTCESPSGRRYVDFQSDGTVDYSFTDRDFNVRSLRATALLRWEYRPGSTVFLVWQRRQTGSGGVGNFDLGRDLSAMFDAPADDRFIVKVNVWLSM